MALCNKNVLTFQRIGAKLYVSAHALGQIKI